MSGRLIRALQSGGMAVQVRDDLWGVWRGRDRRTRKIGELSAPEIDLLRLRGSLAPVAETEPQILIWIGPMTAGENPKPGTTALQSIHPPKDGPLIELIISNRKHDGLRELIRSTAMSYRQDVEAAAGGHQISGMNWTDLALGGRIQGGPARGSRLPNRAAVEARARLRAVERELSIDEVDCLDRLVLARHSRRKLAHRCAIRPSLMESHALAVMRKLAEIYARKIKPID